MKSNDKVTWKGDPRIHTEPRKQDRTEVGGENAWSGLSLGAELRYAEWSENTPEETCRRGNSRWENPEVTETVARPSEHEY